MGKHNLIFCYPLVGIVEFCIHIQYIFLLLILLQCKSMLMRFLFYFVCRHTWAYKYLGFTSSVLGAQLRWPSKQIPKIQTTRWNLELVGILNLGVKRMRWVVYGIFWAQLLCFDQFELEFNHGDIFSLVQVVDKEKKKREAEEMGDAMRALENRANDSKQDMDILAALEEMRSMKVRFGHLSFF